MIALDVLAHEDGLIPTDIFAIVLCCDTPRCNSIIM